MSAQARLKKYNVLLDALRYTSYPSKEELMSFLDSKDFRVSPRTMDRLLDQLRSEFKIDIVYSKERKGYYIDKDNSPGYEKLIRLFSLQQKSRIIQSSFSGAFSHITFENEGEVPSLELIPDIDKAIENHWQINILHKRFNSIKENWIPVKPYLIKEYANRFYLIGINNRNEVRAYGLDRIKKCECSGETFLPDPKFNPLEYYASVIGLNYNPEGAKKVVLAFEKVAGEYIKSLPWHITQEDEEFGNECKITLYVHINIELIQKIIGWGGKVRVLEPLELINRIKNELKEIENLYC